MRKKYRAFISYSHADEVWGRKVHRTLERYFPPRALVGTEGRDGPVPKRLFPIFRDREELPTSSDLGGVITSALEESDYLIVICSPRAAKSKWVNEEILTYKRLGRSDRILCLIVDGEPGGADIQGKEPIECFPDAIRFEIGDDGELTETRAEPIAADARDGKDGWRNAWMKLAAGLLGVDFDALRQRDRTRRRLRMAGYAAAAACLGAVAVFGVMKEREARLAERMEASRSAALRAHDALDRGDEASAIAAVDQAFEGVRALDPAAPGVPPEAITALTRTALETRLLADYPAPASENIAEMRLLPEGVLAIVEEGGRTHLMDPGTGEITTVYDPERFTHTRISEDGDTLWTARLEDERQDENGDWFAPLLFEEAELATGEVRLATAVKSVPTYSASAEISPDGALFAMDLGPGSGEKTVVAAFRREAQELAGVISLPSDRARIQFVDDDVILASITNAPSGAKAPGLYLWRIGEEAPQILRSPTEPTRCAPTGPAMVDADTSLLVTPFGREAAIFIGNRDDGCFHRWSLPDGARLPTVRVERDGGNWAAALAAEGPYVFGRSFSIGRMMTAEDTADPVLIRGCGEGDFNQLDVIGGRRIILCGDDEGAALHFGPSGEMRWTRALHQGGVAGHTYDREAKRLFTIGADARMRIWDAAPRSIGIARTRGELRLIPGDGDRILALTEDGAARKLTVDGDTVGPAIDRPHEDGVITVTALAGDLIGYFTFTRPNLLEGDGDGARNRFTILDAASGDIVSEWSGLRSSNGANLSLSDDRKRFLLRLTNGDAIWGDGETGRALETLSLGEDQPIFGAAVAGRTYALIASNGENDDPEARIMRLFVGGDGAPPRIVREWNAQGADLALSPDGARALVQVHRMPWEGSEVVAVDLKTANATSLAKSELALKWFGLSPDGRFAHLAPDGAATGKDGGVISGPGVFDIATGAQTAALPPIEILDPDPHWSPDGALVAHAGPPLRIFNAASGAEVCPGLAPQAVEHITFSPGATRIAVQREWEDGGDGVEVFDLTTCAPLRRIGAETAYTAPHFPDEDRIWLPLDGEIAEAPLRVDPALALRSIRSRAARLAAE